MNERYPRTFRVTLLSLTLVLLLVVGALVGGCMRPPETVLPPQAPPPEPVTVFLSSPVECVDVLQLPPGTEMAPVWTKPAPKRLPLPPRSQSPQQIVATAQAQARVLPTPLCYFGQSGECTYTWSPGIIYTVLLSAKHGTAINLPAGEKAAATLYVPDKDAWELATHRTGIDLAAHDTVTVRPVNESGELDSYILGESGKRYLFHFIVGASGMLVVNFETPALVDATAKAPALILPKPQP